MHLKAENMNLKGLLWFKDISSNAKQEGEVMVLQMPSHEVLIPL